MHSEQQQNTQLLSGNFLLVAAGKLNLLFPQHQVINITHMDDARYEFDDGNRIFTDTELKRATQYYMSVDDNLQLCATKPEEDRFIITQFDGLDAFLSWREMDVLTEVDLQVMPIAPNLLQQNSPISAVVEIKSKPTFVADAAQFIAYIFNL